jgi:outer membrane protein assembly factor BamB
MIARLLARLRGWLPALRVRALGPLAARLRARPRWIVLAVAALGLLVAGAYALLRAPGDVENADVAFEEEEPARPRAERRIIWPTNGYDEARTRYLPASLGPPFRRVWTVGGSKLIEFQPVLAKQTLFLVNNSGMAVAISTRTGTVRWRKRVGRLAASSPSWWEGRLFITTLSKRVLALNARNRRILWARDLPSRSESSPLTVGGRVYFGSEDGTIYALRARDGRRRWTHRARGEVKGALAYWRGRLYFGDYSGRVTALRASDGRVEWSAATGGRALGRAGHFYSTPAVAFGRVYLGNTDGKVYSFSARDGRLAWTRTTGGYVYAAPAVARVPGTPPTVYVGSYDGRFYALDARSGRPRWTHSSGGRISGAASVIGRVVYFSDLGRKATFGLDVRSGRQVFAFGRGAFNPAVSDGKRLFITGYSGQYAFDPVARRRADRGHQPRGGGGHRARKGRGHRARGSRGHRARKGRDR